MHRGLRFAFVARLRAMLVSCSKQKHDQDALQ
jgi:hypothetical protein